MKTGTCLRPSWTAIVCPTSPGRSSRSATRCGSSASRSRCSSPRCGSSAAPRRTAPSSSSGSTLLLTSPPRADDQLVGLLVLPARALPESRHSPRRHRMAAALRLALAAAVRVVDGIHRGAAHRWALALPTAAAGLAAGDVLVVDVADLADRRPARERHPAHLARGQAQDAEALVLRDELDARAGAPRELAAFAGLQLDVVDERAGRDVCERQRVPRPD